MWMSQGIILWFNIKVSLVYDVYFENYKPIQEKHKEMCIFKKDRVSS